MRLILIILILILFSCKKTTDTRKKNAVHPANIFVHKSQFNLKDSVKSIEQEIFNATGDSSAVVVGKKDKYKTDRDLYPMMFNEKGLQTRVTGFNSRKYAEETTIYSYDSLQRLSGSTTFCKNEKVRGSTVAYKGDSLLIENTESSKGKSLNTVKKRYKTKGDTISFRYTRSGNRDVVKGHSKRFSNGRIIREKITSLNSLGMNVDNKYYYTKNKLDSSRLKMKIRGRTVSDRSYYNKYDDLTKKITSRNKKVETYQYKYDSHNNWIEKTVFRDGKALRVFKRTIKYYE